MKITNGHTVKVHYKGTLTGGEVFDDSRQRGEAMSVIVGEGRLIKGFESALMGMTTGETKTINLTPADAYGDPKPEAINTVPIGAFPEGYPFEVGNQVQGTSPIGNPILATILSFTEEDVTLDMNHPLAGKDLNFEIEVVEITESADTTE